METHLNNLDELERLAKAATPGPWIGDRIDGTVKYDIVAGDYPNGDHTVVCHGDNGNACDGGYGFTSAENEDYVLAANPATILALIAEVRRLSGIVGKYVDPSEVRLTGMVPIDGALHIGLEGGACRLFAGAFAEQFRESGGSNYIEMRFDTDDAQIGELLVTLQRIQGKTPAQCRRDAEVERDALQAEVRVLREALSTPIAMKIKWSPMSENMISGFSQPLGEDALTRDAVRARNVTVYYGQTRVFKSTTEFCTAHPKEKA